MIAAILKLLADLITAGVRDEVQIARDVVDILIQAGIAPALLSEHLTQRDREAADRLVDIIEDAAVK